MTTAATLGPLTDPSNASIQEPQAGTTPAGNWRGTFIATAVYAPLAAATFTVAHYLLLDGVARAAWLPWVGADSLLVGAVLAIVSWSIAAIAYRCAGFTDEAGANIRQHGELAQRLQRLETRLAGLPPAQEGSGASEAARAEATELAHAIKDEIANSGPQWVLGTGYVNVWAHLHRAEEALIEVEWPEEVVDWALKDELRLENSEIDHRDELLATLRAALVDLSESAGRYLHGAKAAVLSLSPTNASARRDSSSGIPATSSSVSLAGHASKAVPGASSVLIAVSEQVIGREVDRPAGAATGDMLRREARAALRNVRRSINEYRDQHWDGLVRSRNHRLIAIAATGLTTYALAALAVIGQVRTDVLLAAVAFYLTGSLTGLFNVLNSQSQADTAIDDYGLTFVRIPLVALISGLAGIAGPLIVATLGDAARVAQGVPGGGPDVMNIFTLSAFQILIAAAFGLTPRLFLDALQQQAEQVKQQLKVSEASQK